MGMVEDRSESDWKMDPKMQCFLDKLRTDQDIRFVESGRLSTFLDNDITKEARVVENYALLTISKQGQYDYFISLYNEDEKQVAK